MAEKKIEEEIGEEKEGDGESKEDDEEEPPPWLLTLKEAKRSAVELHHYISVNCHQVWTGRLEEKNF